MKVATQKFHALNPILIAYIKCLKKFMLLMYNLKKLCFCFKDVLISRYQDINF